MSTTVRGHTHEADYRPETSYSLSGQNISTINNTTTIDKTIYVTLHFTKDIAFLQLLTQLVPSNFRGFPKGNKVNVFIR